MYDEKVYPLIHLKGERYKRFVNLSELNGRFIYGRSHTTNSILVLCR